MAQNDRKFGSDVLVWSMGDQATPVDFVGKLVSASITPDMETQENKALKDAWKYPKLRQKAWKAECTFVVDNDLGTLWTELNNTQVYCQFDTSGAGGVRYTGVGILSAWTHDIPDGPQTIKVTIDGQGALTPGVVTV